MVASIQIGSPFEDFPELFGTQEMHRQRVRLTIAANHLTSQTGAPTATTLLRGSALGVITATGKAVLVDSAATDGSQTLVAILAHDIETGSGDAGAIAYVTGSFLTDRQMKATVL